MKVVVFDTETTGIPIWKEPSENPDQPHIVELSAALIDEDTREVIERIDLVVKPDGWLIPADMTAIHGITNEYAAAEGVPEQQVVERFLMLHAKADLRVAHNESFDARILRIAIKRFLTEEAAEAFKAAPKFCTCWEARPICNVPHPAKKGIKLPTLGEAYKHFTGQTYHDAHRAGPDVDATTVVYFGIRDHNAGTRVEASPAAEPALDGGAAVPLYG